MCISEIKELTLRKQLVVWKVVSVAHTKRYFLSPFTKAQRMAQDGFRSKGTRKKYFPNRVAVSEMPKTPGIYCFTQKRDAERFAYGCGSRVHPVFKGVVPRWTKILLGRNVDGRPTVCVPRVKLGGYFYAK